MVFLTTVLEDEADASMVRVSIIVPTYNCAQWIGRAIQSVLSQTFDDFELIVVNDGSTDNTEEVIGHFAESRVRYEVLPENRGVQHLFRNTCVSKKVPVPKNYSW